MAGEGEFDSSTCSTYAKAYASPSLAIFYFPLSAMYLWTFFYFIMRAYANDETSHSTSIKSPGEPQRILLKCCFQAQRTTLKLKGKREATIPCITLLVGANLLKGLKGSGVGALVIIGILTVKYIILPSLGIGAVKAARHLGFVESNSLYEFRLMLHCAVPPAMTIGTFTQLVQTSQSECSVVMLWTCSVAAFFLTLWSALFMWVVD